MPLAQAKSVNVRDPQAPRQAATASAGTFNLGSLNHGQLMIEISNQPRVVEVQWCSSLPQELTNSLDRLLFHNSNQGIWNDYLEATIERVGSPAIHSRSDGRIFVELESPGAVQSLIAVVDSQPVGVIIYSRNNQSLRVLFLAVHEEWTMANRSTDAIFLHAFARLEWIAHRIAGINEVLFFPGSQRELRFQIKKRKSEPQD